MVSAIMTAATKPVTGPSPITVPNAICCITRVAEQRTDHHADAIHRHRHADAGSRESETVHRIGNEYGEQQKRAVLKMNWVTNTGRSSG